MDTKSTADQAITESITHDRIVTIIVEKDEFDSLEREFDRRCDDSVLTTGAEGVAVHEYWGRDDDGDDWRVHIEREYHYIPDAEDD